MNADNIPVDQGSGIKSADGLANQLRKEYTLSASEEEMLKTALKATGPLADRVQAIVAIYVHKSQEAISRKQEKMLRLQAFTGIVMLLISGMMAYWTYRLLMN